VCLLLRESSCCEKALLIAIGVSCAPSQGEDCTPWSGYAAPVRLSGNPQFNAALGIVRSDDGGATWTSTTNFPDSPRSI
jgi:hypothetical protein